VKIRFVLLTCEKYLERQKAQRETWLQDQDFVFLSDEPGPQKVGYGTTIGYDNMAMKYIAFFKDRSNYDPTLDWYHFADDDGYVLVHNLVRHLQNVMVNRAPDRSIATGFPLWFSPDKAVYAPNMRGEKTDIHVQFYAGGAGFAISRALAERLFDYIGSHPNPPWNGYADVTIGYWFRAIGDVLMHDCLLLHKLSWKEMQHPAPTVKSQIGYHWLSPELMRELHGIVTS
jgi:hypothetical protein